MARKIICDLPNNPANEDKNCTGVVAHQISPRMVQVARPKEQRVSIVGENWNATVTCSRCGRPHSLICKNGAIIEEGHKYEDIETPTPPADPAENPDTPPAPEGNPGPADPTPEA